MWKFCMMSNLLAEPFIRLGSLSLIRFESQFPVSNVQIKWALSVLSSGAQKQLKLSEALLGTRKLSRRFTGYWFGSQKGTRLRQICMPSHCHDHIVLLVQCRWLKGQDPHHMQIYLWEWQLWQSATIEPHNAVKFGQALLPWCVDRHTIEQDLALQHR